MNFAPGLNLVIALLVHLKWHSPFYLFSQWPWHQLAPLRHVCVERALVPFTSRRCVTCVVLHVLAKDGSLQSASLITCWRPPARDRSPNLWGEKSRKTDFQRRIRANISGFTRFHWSFVLVTVKVTAVNSLKCPENRPAGIATFDRHDELWQHFEAGGRVRQGPDLLLHPRWILWHPRWDAKPVQRLRCR